MSIVPIKESTSARPQARFHFSLLGSSIFLGPQTSSSIIYTPLCIPFSSERYPGTGRFPGFQRGPSSFSPLLRIVEKMAIEEGLKELSRPIVKRPRRPGLGSSFSLWGDGAEAADGREGLFRPSTAPRLRTQSERKVV